jgi:hypothetical protein
LRPGRMPDRGEQGQYNRGGVKAEGVGSAEHK